MKSLVAFIMFLRLAFRLGTSVDNTSKPPVQGNWH